MKYLQQIGIQLLHKMEGKLNMIRYILLWLCLSVSAIGYCKSIIFVTADNIPISKVDCVGYSANNDSIASWISNENGVIDINTKNVNYIIASRSGFSDKIIYDNRLKDGNNTMVMAPGVELKEVVVNPSDVTEFATHTSYRISQKI